MALQELAALRSQLTGTVNVEVDAAPQQDLNKVLDEIRSHYENIIQKHRREQEAWFKDQVRHLLSPSVYEFYINIKFALNNKQNIPESHFK